MKINIKRLQRFVKTLQAMKQDMPIDMASTENPQCGTPGCHAGLAMLALDKMGIKQTKYFISEGYYSIDQSNRLARYLFAQKRATYRDLKNWAYENRKIWGNGFGERMFSIGLAFDQTTGRFPSSVIVDHWAGVLDRLINSRTQTIFHRLWIR